MTPRLALFVVAGLAVATPTADAAIVRSSEGNRSIVFSAAPGERNDVHVHVEAGANGKGRSVVFEDSGAPLTTGNGCTPEGAVVRCGLPARSWGETIELGDMDDRAVLSGEPPKFAPSVWLTGGDGDDVATALTAVFAAMDGEAGNDRLEAKNAFFTGGEGDDELIGDFTPDSIEGDAGADVIVGGAGNDTLEGGEDDDRVIGDDGRDAVFGGGRFGATRRAGMDALDGGDGTDRLYDSDREPGPDVLDGGRGVDTVGSYARRNTSVRVDLSQTGGQGREGENDTFTEIERVYGSKGADVLLGTDGPDILNGNGGEDRVEGLGGDDRVGASHGTVDAGEGDDHVLDQAWDRGGWSEATLSCGAGIDVVRRARPSRSRRRPAGAGAGALISEDCEQLRFSGFALSPLPVQIERSGKVTFAFTRRYSDPEHTLSLRRPQPPFEELVKRHLRGQRVTLQLPPAVVEEWEREPVIIRAKLGGPRDRWIPRVWRFQIAG